MPPRPPGFWVVGQSPPRPPPLNGRSSHLIEAAKRGRLDQMIFFRRRLRYGCADVDRPKTAENGSDRRETLGKRVSDDSQHFIFRRRKKKLANIFDNIFVKNFFRGKIDKLPVFAELWIFGRNRQMRLEKLPPKF